MTIKRRKLKLREAYGNYQGDAENNWLCATELADWVHLPDDLPETIWLCISTRARNENFAYRYWRDESGEVTGPDCIRFVIEDTTCGNSPFATSTDKYWCTQLPKKGWAWIEYEEGAAND